MFLKNNFRKRRANLYYSREAKKTVLEAKRLKRRESRGALDNQDFLVEIKEVVVVEQMKEELRKLNESALDKENKQLNNQLKQQEKDELMRVFSEEFVAYVIDMCS